MKGMWITAVLGASAAAAAAYYGSRRKSEEQQALKTDVRKWEDEGGNIPQVPTPTPAPVPEQSNSRGL